MKTQLNKLTLLIIVILVGIVVSIIYSLSNLKQEKSIQSGELNQVKTSEVNSKELEDNFSSLNHTVL